MGARVATERGATALRSPVSWALLGLVIQRPSYGYELVQRFERTFDDALELSSPSQIYTALDTLVGRSLIEEIVVDDEAGHEAARQPKPNYRATDGGVRSYEEWLVAQIPEERRRSRLFARQLAALPPQTALGIIERCERACLDEARDTLPAGTGEAPPADGGARLAARLLSEEGRVAVEARLAWLEYARREIRALAGERTPGR
jgi:DNA-binding PadR family transcriptional regulator